MLALALVAALLAAAPVRADSDYTETVPPETTIDVGPLANDTIIDRTPEFEFSSDEPDSTFACSVDGSVFAPCRSPHETAPLGDGRHTFAVRATNPAGNTDPTPATRSFVVEATPPDTAFVRKPEHKVLTTKRFAQVEFAFVSTEPRSRFECAREGGEFFACTSPLTYRAAAGHHIILVRAIDRYGNADQSPKDFFFTVKRKRHL
jgi:hypothetical protein